MSATPAPLRVLEFYSGIGGMHFALQGLARPVEVLGAYDINTSANTIYRHNFPKHKQCQNNIQKLSAADLDKASAELWTMSPPCQPFTKKGLQLGEADPRCESLYSLLEQLAGMAKPPRFIFVENVVGFEETSVHRHLFDSLHKRGYDIKEYILSPMQFGHPNSRPRYYLQARLSEQLSEASRSPPPVSLVLRSHRDEVDGCRPVGEYLEDIGEDEAEKRKLLVDARTLEKYSPALDVVTLESTRSACFTKSYGSYVSGCGSYVCMQPDLVDGNRLRAGVTAEEAEGRVRRLSWREMANLMSFPSRFSRPPHASEKQMYKTLGNSVNVLVVRTLLGELLGLEEKREDRADKEEEQEKEQ